MFGIHKKINQWQKAGLITMDQARAMMAYESTRTQGRFGRGMIGLALFAIGIGILSVIAANWALIPGSVKLSAHTLINAGLAFFIWHLMTATDRRAMAREGLVLLLFFLTLTWIALIGQVFQLGGSYGPALLVWLVAALPMLFLCGRTKMTAIAGIVAVTLSAPVITIEYAEMLDGLWQGIAVAAVAAFLPSGLIASGHASWVRDHRPVWAPLLQRAGFILLTLGASLACIFYHHDRMTSVARIGGIPFMDGYLDIIAVFAVTGVAMLAHWIMTGPVNRSETYRLCFAYIAVALAMMVLPFLIPVVEGEIVAALIFMAYWIYIGWFGQRTGAMRLVSLAILVLAVRIYILYLQVFGDLLSTGFGLILGGGVMLAMIYGARRVDRMIRTRSGKGTS